jgi:signal transduction histidine kinase
MITTDFGGQIAERMRESHRALATRWFDRLLDLLPVEAREVFPSDTLLDHIPALIREISNYLHQPENQAIAANTAIMEKARELGALRYTQRASLHQVLREYHVLGGVLVTFVVEEMSRLDTMPSALEGVVLVSRLNQAVNVLSQATVESFVTLYTQTIADQNERLEQFTRMAAHEWRQPLGTLQFGVRLLRRRDLDPPRFDRALDAVERNVQHMVDLTNKLESIARMHGACDNAIVQTISATTVVQEAARQLREMADARGVVVRIDGDLPTMTVDVGRLELLLVNLLSNAVKYSDDSKTERFVSVSGGDGEDGWCRLEVSDNGVGIPDHALTVIFQRFTRAHADRDDLSHITGLGLGLAIAEDCVRAMGGRIDVRSVEGEGTTFVANLPKQPAPVNESDRTESIPD